VATRTIISLIETRETDGKWQRSPGVENSGNIYVLLTTYTITQMNIGRESMIRENMEIHLMWKRIKWEIMCSYT
jgi:hypothetical protein